MARAGVSVLGLLILGAIGAAPVSAQNASSGPVLKFVERDPGSDAGFNQRMFNQLEVTRDTTLRELFEELSELFEVTIVVPKSGRDQTFPKVKLRNVRPEQAFDLLAAAADGSFTVHNSGDGEPQFTVQIEEQDDGMTICRVFSFADDNSGMAMENISSASELALRVVSEASGTSRTRAPRIEMHRPTKLIIVAGTRADVDVVGSVIVGLGGTPIAVPKLQSDAPAGGAGGGLGGAMGGLGGKGS